MTCSMFCQGFQTPMKESSRSAKNFVETVSSFFKWIKCKIKKDCPQDISGRVVGVDDKGMTDTGGGRVVGVDDKGITDTGGDTTETGDGSSLRGS